MTFFPSLLQEFLKRVTLSESGTVTRLHDSLSFLQCFLDSSQTESYAWGIVPIISQIKFVSEEDEMDNAFLCHVMRSDLCVWQFFNHFPRRCRISRFISEIRWPFAARRETLEHYHTARCDTGRWIRMNGSHCGGKNKKYPACCAEVDEDSFPSRLSADTRWRKNYSENEASNWTPGGHIRAHGDRRRWERESGRRKSETTEGKGRSEKTKEMKKDAERETEKWGSESSAGTNEPKRKWHEQRMQSRNKRWILK